MNKENLYEILEGVKNKHMNVDDAFEKLKTFLPDLILLDIVMPKTGGFDVCKKLKAENRTHDIHLPGIKPEINGILFLWSPRALEHYSITPTLHHSLDFSRQSCLSVP